jgi:hypothetical protein
VAAEVAAAAGAGAGAGAGAVAGEGAAAAAGAGAGAGGATQPAAAGRGELKREGPAPEATPAVKKTKPGDAAAGPGAPAACTEPSWGGHRTESAAKVAAESRAESAQVDEEEGGAGSEGALSARQRVERRSQVGRAYAHWPEPDESDLAFMRDETSLGAAPAPGTAEWGREAEDSRACAQSHEEAHLRRRSARLPYPRSYHAPTDCRLALLPPAAMPMKCARFRWVLRAPTLPPWERRWPARRCPGRRTACGGSTGRLAAIWPCAAVPPSQCATARSADVAAVESRLTSYPLTPPRPAPPRPARPPLATAAQTSGGRRA